MHPPLKIGLKFGAPSVHSREVYRGAALAIERRRLQWPTPKGVNLAALDTAVLANLDGVIGYFDTQAIALLHQSRTPSINVSNRTSSELIPLVTSDSRAIGSLAADHLAGLGYRRMAYIGLAGFAYSSIREAAFFARLDQLLSSYERYRYLSPQHGCLPQTDSLDKFLYELPRPGAVFCCNDHMAVKVARILHSYGRSVPGDHALLGVDDDDLPILPGGLRLSSVKPNFDAIGSQALEQLLHWLTTGNAPEKRSFVAPVGLQIRQSTDFSSAVDLRIARAMQYIREHACNGIGVADVLKGIPLSRRYFETQFRNAFGCSPYEEILRLRMEAAKVMLIQAPQLSIAEVADRCGYSNGKQFSSFFRKFSGATPSEFRRATKC